MRLRAASATLVIAASSPRIATEVNEELDVAVGAGDRRPDRAVGMKPADSAARATSSSTRFQIAGSRNHAAARYVLATRLELRLHERDDPPGIGQQRADGAAAPGRG